MARGVAENGLMTDEYIKVGCSTSGTPEALKYANMTSVFWRGFEERAQPCGHGIRGSFEWQRSIEERYCRHVQ